MRVFGGKKMRNCVLEQWDGEGEREVTEGASAVAVGELSELPIRGQSAR